MNKPALEEIYRGSFKNRNRHGVEMHGTGGDIGYIATPENQYQTYNPVSGSISYSSASPNGVAGYGMGNNSTIPSAQDIAGIGPNDGLTTAQQQTLATEMAADNANNSSKSSGSSSSSSGALGALAKELGISGSSSSSLQALLLGVGLLGAAGSYSRNKSVSQLPSIPQTGLFNANSSSSIGNQSGASYGPNGKGYNYTAYKGAVSGTPGTGYAPRAMVAPMPSSAYYTYGQMPEHSFFAPVSAKKGGHITTPQRFLVGGLSGPGGTVGQTVGNPGGPSGAALPAGSQASSSGINSGGTPSGYTPPAPIANAGLGSAQVAGGGVPSAAPVQSSNYVAPVAGAGPALVGGGATATAPNQSPTAVHTAPVGQIPGALAGHIPAPVQPSAAAVPSQSSIHAAPAGQNPAGGLPVSSGPTTLQPGPGQSYMNPLGSSTSGGSMQNASSSAPAAGAVMGPAADNLGSTLYAGSELPFTGALNPGLAKYAMSSAAQNFMKQPGMASYLQANPGFASALQNPGTLTAQGMTNWYNNAGPGVQSYLKSNPGLMNSVEQAARPYAHGGAAPGPQGALSAMSRHVQGPGDGTSDSIPARLANGEYVMDAQTVSMLGNGDNGSGAKRLDEFRQNLRKHKGQALARGKMAPDAKPVERYMGGSR